MKYGALGAAWAALPACDQRPLSTELSGEGGSGGTTAAGAGGTTSVSGAGGNGSGGAPGSGGAAGTGAGGTGCTGNAVAIGNAAAVVVGNLQVLGSVVVGRDAGGLYAMSTVCTHEGCTVDVVGAAGQETLSCPCHGSAFDGNGAVTRGPARTPLPHYQIAAAADGSLSICVGSIVSASTRTPLP